MKKIIHIVVLFFAFLNFGKAHTILIYSQDFEGATSSLYLNTYGNGTNTGNNIWIINDSYDGGTLYPNTTDQTQTTGGNISFPNSKYLHIYDEAADISDGISNCNYDPTSVSDRFVQFGTGFCTLGMTNVKFSFFYLCEGSPDAYAEIYYSADNGPWTQIGTYSNQMIWKNVSIQNAAFNNLANLKFGIKWVNNSGTLPGKMSFGIDDIFLTGDFDNSVAGYNVIIDSVIPNPVCQNTQIKVFFHKPVSICGDGFYEVELSDVTGSFSSSTSLGIYQFSNQQSSETKLVTIPGNATPGTCYKIRIKFYYTYYALNFYSNASACFEVINCPNTITTSQPVICNEDTVCINSIILVPFFSTGVFLSANNYYAELSDSTGAFSSNLNQIGSIHNNTTYAASPGSVGGLIYESTQPIPDGCNYYIRVSSTAPAITGSEWGPFCLMHCDIETNYKQPLHACISSTQGYDTLINIDINHFDSSATAAVYDPTNQFLLEIRDPTYFSVVNLGGVGSVTANSDTTMQIHIPPFGPALSALGLAPGLWYVRIIATSSTHPYDVLGTIITLTIGAPADNLSIWQYPSDSVFCVGDVVEFYPDPDNSDMPMYSSYEWFLNGSLQSTAPAIGILFVSQGTFHLTVQETNFGCKGPIISNNTTLFVLGPPSPVISGPSQACLGDTLHYQVPFQNSTYYDWSPAYGGTVIDTSNNELNIRFDNEGVYTDTILSLNKCGQSVGYKNVIITKHPDASFSLLPDTLCTGDTVTLSYTGISTQPLTFTWNFDGGVGSPGGNNPNQHAEWNSAGQHNVILTVTKYGCPSKDTSSVYVLQSPKPAFSVPNQCFGTPTVFTDSSQGNINSWLWFFGEGNASSTLTNPTHLYQNYGTFEVQLILSSPNGCVDTLKQNILINQAPLSTFSFNSPICLDASSIISYTGNVIPNANYSWNFNGANILSGSGIGPYEITWTELGVHNVELTASENGCISKTVEPITMDACEIIIPNVITPSGDNKNDVFLMKGLESFPNSKLQIFNRWGKKIFESADYKNDWGADNNSDGVYYWVLTLKNGKSMKGTVTVLK